MRRIEARVFGRIEAVFARCPELFRFSVRDRSGLPDHIDPTTLDGELFIFVNDAVIGIPGLYDFFYRNNGGSGKLTLTRKY